MITADLPPHDRHLHWTKPLPFDGLLVFDASDDETASEMLLRLGAQGNVQSTTTRAFTATELDKVLGKMGG